MRPKSMLHVLLGLSLLAAPAASLLARPVVEIDVVDRDRGTVLPQYRRHGDAWVPGEPGHRYAVRLANTTPGRVLVVLSVDGVNAVTGETAAPGQAGYVLEPWQTAEIAGWRKSMADVAQFVFTDLPDSYAARTGRPGNVGVIGIAVFREARQPAAPPPSIAEGADADAAPGAARAAAAEAAAPRTARRQQLGTGHGAREWAPVRRSAFERATSRPAQVVELRYDAPERLVALGIMPRPGWLQEGAPRAFPVGFVPDPPR